MKTFHDTAGRQWTCQIDVGALRRVRAMLGIDLAAASIDPGKLGPIIEDPVTLANVLYCVLEPALRQAGVTDEQFGAALAGETILEARNALLQGLIDFFPRPQRDVLALAVAKAQAMEHQVMGRVSRALETGELEQAVDAGLDRMSTSGGSSTEPPASSE